MKKKIKEDENSILTSQSQLDSFLKTNKDSHFNFQDVVDYKVSSGSMILDYHLGGGFGPGLHRFIGQNEGGKTSAALQVLKNFLNKENDNRKGLYIKAEGRLSQEIIERSGVQFVTDPEKWVHGTCFVLDTNIYETAVDAMRQLVWKNEEKNKYFFIIDSVDGLSLKNDVNKNFDESAKVAGGATVAAVFMKRCAIALQKLGHMAIFISQVRDSVDLDPYSSNKSKRNTSATGGNALLHFANWILSFEHRYKSDYFLKDEKALPDPITNPYIGHDVKMIVKKSPNEKTNSIIKYPIKYGRKNGTSNWIEKEISRFLFGWGLIVKKGAWLKFSDDIIELAGEQNIDLSTQIQGAPKLEKMIDEDPNIKNFFLDYILNKLSASTIVKDNGTSNSIRQKEKV